MIMTKIRVKRNNIVAPSISLIVLMMCTEKRWYCKKGRAQPYTCAIFVSYSVDGQGFNRSIVFL